MLLPSLLIFSTFLQLSTSYPAPLSTTTTTIVNTALKPLRTIHAFPSSWNENLHLTDTPSELLITQISSPSLYLLDTTTNTNNTPLLIHSFAPYSGVLGITSLPSSIPSVSGSKLKLKLRPKSKSIYYVVVGNFSLSPPSLGIGSYSIYSVDLTTITTTATIPKVAVSHLASLPLAGLTNGLATLDPHRGILIAADSTYGIIWGIDARGGNVTKLLAEPEMAPPAGNAFAIGINGVHVVHSGNSTGTAWIYFSNTGTLGFYRVLVDLMTLKKVGEVRLVVQGVAVDDFVIDERRGFAYLAAGSLGVVVRVGLGWGEGVGEEEGRVVTMLGGNGMLVGPTSVVMAVGGAGKLYITTNTGLLVEGAVGC